MKFRVGAIIYERRCNVLARINNYFDNGALCIYDLDILDKDMKTIGYSRKQTFTDDELNGFVFLDMSNELVWSLYAL